MDRLSRAIARTALPHDAEPILRLVVRHLRETVREQLVGVYLRGSAVTGDFDIETSDIDLLAVVEHALSEADLATLCSMHRQILRSPDAYARRVEVAYLDRRALRRFEPGLQHPMAHWGEEPYLTDQRDDWVVERWTMRGRGVALVGPDPCTLIDPVSWDEVRVAVRAQLRYWATFARTPEIPAWLRWRASQAYVVETVCRALATLACDELPTKPRAVRWALASLPEPWRSVVARVSAGRAGNARDARAIPRIKGFLEWAASQP